MRVSYIVRTTNAWFSRVVYERDSWDESLHDWSQESGIGSLIAVAVRACVAVTRRDSVGVHDDRARLSCFLLRQMEFDADRSFVRLVGVSRFAAPVARASNACRIRLRVDGSKRFRSRIARGARSTPSKGPVIYEDATSARGLYRSASCASSSANTSAAERVWPAADA